MPKESKKFINPLLRPSQEAETKTELPTRPQKSSGEPLIIEPPVVSDVVEHNHSDALAQEKFRETSASVVNFPISTKTSTLPDTSTSTDTLVDSPQRKKGNEQQRKTSLSAAPTAPPFVNTDTPNTEKNELTDNLLSLRPDRIVSPGQPDGILLQREEKYSATNTSTSTDTSTNMNTYPLSPPLMKQEPGYSTAPNVIAQEEQAPIQAASTPDETVHKRIKERPSFTAAESVRRKRGPLAFENTHERITLWIDKSLKQGFEELASERELPKTALLNEAIADLLRKYDLQ